MGAPNCHDVGASRWNIESGQWRSLTFRSAHSIFNPRSMKRNARGEVISKIAPTLLTIPHTFQLINGHQLTVLWVDDEHWLIGVQVAALLERETYNLYQSMKVKNIALRRATSEQVEFLQNHDLVRTWTRSATLVPLDQSVSFL